MAAVIKVFRMFERRTIFKRRPRIGYHERDYDVIWPCPALQTLARHQGPDSENSVIVAVTGRTMQPENRDGEHRQAATLQNFIMNFPDLRGWPALIGAPKFRTIGPRHGSEIPPVIQ